MRPFVLMVEYDQNRHSCRDHGEIPSQPLQVVSRGRGDIAPFGVGGLDPPRDGNRQSQSPHRGSHGLTGADVGPPAISDHARDTLNGSMLADAANSVSHVVRAAPQ
jgi:hypothetical protein